MMKDFALLKQPSFDSDYAAQDVPLRSKVYEL